MLQADAHFNTIGYSAFDSWL